MNKRDTVEEKAEIDARKRELLSWNVIVLFSSLDTGNFNFSSFQLGSTDDDVTILIFLTTPKDTYEESLAGRRESSR